MSVIHSEMSGVIASMHSPAITASSIATLRTGSRAANQKSRLRMSAKPPVSLRRNRSKVETSPLRRPQEDPHDDGLASEDHEKTSKGHQKREYAQNDAQGAIRWSRHRKGPPSIV